MAVYSQRQVGVTFTCVLQDITNPDAPADYDPGNANAPDAPALYMVFRRPDGSITTRRAHRASRAVDDPGGDANDDDIVWTTTEDDPLLDGWPGVWHRSARAVSADGLVVIESPDWIKFVVM